MDHRRGTVTTNYSTHGQGESWQALNTYVCCLGEARIRKDWEPTIHAAMNNNACVCECRVCATTHPAAAHAYDAHGAPPGGKTTVHLARRKSTVDARLHVIDAHSATQRRTTYVVKWMWFIPAHSRQTQLRKMEERKTKLKDVLIDLVYFNTMAILCPRGLRLTSLKPIDS
jgi:hypothetical protein